MYALDKIKHELAQEINKLLNTSVSSVVDFVLPSDQQLGDLSLPCFNLAKKLNQAPNEIAGELEKKINSKFINSAKAVGPYLNFTLSPVAIKEILTNFKKTKNFGVNAIGNKQRVMIEYANQNTHKILHIGHLRNMAYGEAVSRILAANSYQVFPVSYINDFGIHVAKTIWWLIKEPQESLAKAYEKASAELLDNPAGNEEVSRIMQAIESRRGEYYKLWKKTRQQSLEQFARVYQELNIKFKTTFYENELIDQGLAMVKALEKKNILVKSDGAIIADLEKYNLGVLVVLRSDGTALYPVADLALAIKKIKNYKLDQSLYIVDVRQGLYFDQLFKLLELLGYSTKFEHLNYEFVKLPSGMMSSRTGNIISYEELKDLALSKAKEEIIKRHANWDNKKINQVSSVVAFGALKFEMIKVGALKQITFDIDKALKFEGNTAAYLQYTYARIQSINNKADKKIKSGTIDYSKLTEEKTLILELANWPKIVALAGEKKDPAEIAKYLFDLAKLINDYYHATPVLKADIETARARLFLMNSLATIIKSGLNLLGIEVVREM